MDDFLVVSAKSRYDLLLARHQSHDAVMHELVFDEVRQNIIEGHMAQKRNLEYLVSIFGSDHILADRSLLTKELAKNYSFVISAGGDEHFCYVAHKIGDVPVVGYVLDERRSTGALLYFAKNNLEHGLRKIVAGDYWLEKWSKIGVAINDIQVDDAVSFYSFSESDSDDNSRQKIIYHGKEHNYRVSSGVHVTTGCGSTGWYRQLHNDCYHSDDAFGKEKRKIKAFVRETGCMEGRKFVIEEGDELVIVSYYDSDGKARPDALKEYTYAFNMGYVARVGVSKERVNVVSIAGP